MPLQLNPRLLAVARAFSYLASLIVVVVGGLVLLGWVKHLDYLKTLVPGLPSMRPDTALWLILSGSSLFFLNAGRGKLGWMVLGRVLALALLVLNLIALADILTGIDLSLGSALGQSQVLPVVFAYSLVACALLFLDYDARSGFRPTEALALTASCLPYLTLLGETYHPSFLTHFFPLTGMTLRSALVLLAVCGGLFCSRADRGLMALMMSDTPGGLLFRRLLPAVLALPVALGWVRLATLRAGYVDEAVGLALATAGMTLAGVILVIWNVITFNRLTRESQAAQEAIAKLARIVEFSHDAIVGLDTRGIITSWNRGAQALFGYQATEIIGLPLAKLVPPDRIDENTDILALARRGEQVAPYETSRVAKDGRLVEVSISTSTIRDVAGRVVGFAGILRDITERKRMQDALRDSEERYRRLVELAPEAVFVVRDELIVYANRAAAMLAGAQKPEDLVGKPAESFIYPPDATAFRDRMREVSERGKPMVLAQERAVRLDGTLQEVETSASPIVYEGQPAVIALVRDITERKRAIEGIARRDAELRKMLEVDKLKDHFLSTVSHEMKTPLTLITGYAELLADKYPQETLVEGIQEGSRRLTENINKMIDFSALVSGAMPLHLNEINLSELLGDLEAITRERFANKGVRLKIEIDEGVPSIEADSRRITQVVLELLTNALRFTPHGGEVGIRVSPFDQEVRLDVRDTGQGISEEDFPSIWSAFGHRQHGQGSGSKGLGLGLAIVKLLVDSHGGRVALESMPGKGSCFSIFLPVRQRIPATAPLEART